MPQVLADLAWQIGIYMRVKHHAQDFVQSGNEVGNVSFQCMGDVRFKVREHDLCQLLAETRHGVKRVDALKQKQRQSLIVPAFEAFEAPVLFHVSESSTPRKPAQGLAGSMPEIFVKYRNRWATGRVEFGTGRRRLLRRVNVGMR